MAPGGVAGVECGGTPFKVVVRLRTPVALYGWPWIAFDGLVAHLAARKRDPDGFRVLSGGPRVAPLEEVAPTVPLDRVGPIYTASVSFFDTGLRWKTTIYKRFYAAEEVYTGSGRRRRIETAKGEFRSWMVGLVLIPARTVTFYARGDPDAVRELLGGLYAVGHKRAAGYGVVDRVEVIETSEDYSIIGPDGRLTRPVPVDMLDYFEGEAFVGTYRPPYWDRRNTALLAAPGARARLKREYMCG